jgi:hypothetical protein
MVLVWMIPLMPIVLMIGNSFIHPVGLGVVAARHNMKQHVVGWARSVLAIPCTTLLWQLVHRFVNVFDFAA